MKVFRTYNEQIEKLIEKGLKIDNLELAKQKLLEENYYNIINGYKSIFLASTNPETFMKDCSFDTLLLFYEYDKWLRHNILNLTLDLENNLKSILSYIFSKNHGPYSYITKANYVNKPEKVEKFISIFTTLIDNAIKKYSTDPRFDHIRHFYYYHNKQIPLWVIINNFTFNNLVKFYELLYKSDQNEVCDQINKIYSSNLSPSDLLKCLKILNNARNYSAHNQRIYCFKTKEILSSNNKIMQYINQSKNKINTQNINSIIIALNELTKNTAFEEFARRLFLQLSDILKTAISPQIKVAILNNSIDINLLSILISE